MIPLVVAEPKWCTLCGTEGRTVQADWEIAYASGETAIVACTPHFGEAATMAMISQTADRIVVYSLTIERMPDAV